MTTHRIEKRMSYDNPPRPYFVVHEVIGEHEEIPLTMQWLDIYSTEEAALAAIAAEGGPMTARMLARLAALQVDLHRAWGKPVSRPELEEELTAIFTRYLADCTPRPGILQLVPPPSDDPATV